MIFIESQEGDLIKVLHNVADRDFGLHQLFGFISKERAQKKEITRKRQGHEFTRNLWNCGFKIQGSENSWELTNLENCQASKEDHNTWSLITPDGTFFLKNQQVGNLPTLLEDSEDNQKWLNKLLEYSFLLVFLLVPLIFYFQSEAPQEEKTEEENEPITVKVVQPVNTVRIAQDNPAIKVKPLTKKEKSNRAVKRNLGFLGLVGSKNMKNIVGGVPTELKQATAGAGPGGDAGSGGEVLTGLGKGLKRTTVGNTGVKGLGGVGTKGAGGGKGGYGNTMVASGEGQGISEISVSGSDMVLDGGLSRYAINATIAKYINQVRRCYENQLKNSPGLEGLVTVNFLINGRGRLNHSRVVKSSLGNKKVESCITNKMMTWEFPKPKGGVNVNVNYPFMLRPVST